MFPNPQDALPLPLRPNLERYKKLAKGLVKSCKSADETAVHVWVEQWIRSLAQLSGEIGGPSSARGIGRTVKAVEAFAQRTFSGGASGQKKCTLTAAQFILARSHGFESWPKFAKHLEALARKSSPTSKFEQAADAIVTGDLPTLKRLLREDPNLVHAKSLREHGATLLHYVSANGVENYRQRTPKNIVEIAGLLLKSGAAVDATANVYGGDCTTLGLAATSVHPERAGVQKPLLQVLLDHGALLKKSNSAGNRQSLVVACLANGRLQAAEFLAHRGARLDLMGAAGVGRLDVVKTFFDESGNLRPNTTKQQCEDAFFYSCEYGRIEVVKFFLQLGMNIAAQDRDGQSALHWAVIGGHPEVAKLLLERNAPLEVKNIYGGTVLGQTLWSAAHGGDPEVYIVILDALTKAGARMPDRYIPINARLDAWLTQHGSRPEPAWHWDGED
jgi:hypothetical protein